MSSTAAHSTAEDLWNLPQDHLRHELIRGEITTYPLCDALHGCCSVQVLTRIGEFVKRHQLGTCFAGGTGFLLHRNPDTVLAPDFAFVGKTHMVEHGLMEWYYPAAPDLAVEVLSPSDSACEFFEKIDCWLQGGVGLLWVVDPQRKTIRVIAPGRAWWRLRDVEFLDGADVLPGLRLPVADLFT
jgi:Uma2 family endonuclease